MYTLYFYHPLLSVLISDELHQKYIRPQKIYSLSSTGRKNKISRYPHPQGLKPGSIINYTKTWFSIKRQKQKIEAALEPVKSPFNFTYILQSFRNSLLSVPHSTNPQVVSTEIESARTHGDPLSTFDWSIHIFSQFSLVHPTISLAGRSLAWPGLVWV